MNKCKKLCYFGMLSLVLAAFFTFLPISTPPTLAASTWQGHTNAWVNVRASVNSSSKLVSTLAPDTNVTIYESVKGQAVWGGISTWYRISSSTKNAQYAYSPLVDKGKVNLPSVPNAGKVILIKLGQQHLYAYDNHNLMYQTLVTSGRPGLETPTGTYHIFEKDHPTTFHSPWPLGSPYYYPPTYINYALAFREDGYFIHDATWRSEFGPGTNKWHNDPVYGWMTGSHGCINVDLNAAHWLYTWASNGTTVQITN